MPFRRETKGPTLDELHNQLRRVAAENDRLYHQLVTGEDRLRRLARAVWRIQEDERRRLAGELHDGLGQSLTALKIRLQRLAQGRDDPELEQALHQAAEAAGDALQESRRLSHLLRPRVLDDLGLIPALNWLVRTMREQTGLEIELDVNLPDDGPELEADFETMIFRIVQEALTNAVKHADTDHVEVALVSLPDRLWLRIADDGRGFEPDTASKGHGLGSMRDRVEVCGGRLSIHTRPGSGTTIEADIPLEEGVFDTSSTTPTQETQMNWDER